MATASKSGKAQRGFAVMSDKARARIASMGGKASASKAKRGKNGRFAPRGKGR
jgi:hypothetical protein